ncbi:YggT family protein [Brachybacterium sp. JHP9]|uniref:YggT family protein n=1 Tax=Brachybacterium equifaecis TaxID=2910770 RepID=A0ABT0QWJ1_9MICO|nr:YggT family protein [Brachybacterium equifaecis]
MEILASVLYLGLLLYSLLLLARLVIDWIRGYARDYRPRGAVLVLFETVFTLTDPPVKLLRRLIPPVRLGAVALDLSLMVLLLACSLVLSVLARFAI